MTTTYRIIEHFDGTFSVQVRHGFWFEPWDDTSCIHVKKLEDAQLDMDRRIASCRNEMKLRVLEKRRV